jgi:hypothetical protein
MLLRYNKIELRLFENFIKQKIKNWNYEKYIKASKLNKKTKKKKKTNLNKNKKKKKITI